MLGKRLIKSGADAAAGGFVPSEHFETVTYTGNGGTQRIGGYINRGAVFNGSSRIDLPYLGSITPTSDFTISCWVNAGNQASGDNTIVSLWDNANIELRVDGTSFNTVRVIYYTSGFGFINSSFTLTENEWTHLTVTYEYGVGFTFYKNSSASILYSFTSTVGTSTGTNKIGQYAADTINSYFIGKIDQVRIFNKALSSGEVTTLYGETYASSTVSTTDIFNDNSGIALYQLDGNANDTGGVSGKFGEGGIFNGSSSQITFDSFTPTSTMSVSLWMKLNSSPTINKIAIEFSNGYGLNFNTYANGKIAAQYANSNSSHNLSNSVIASNEWVHIAANFQSGSSQLYVNGVLQSGGSVADYLTSDQNTIGSRRTGEFFNGSIDQVRIFNKVLSSSEVTTLYGETSATASTFDIFSDSSAVALYQLDGDARDTGNLYDGTATNVTYAYNGTATNVTYQEATKFQPDLVWIKSREYAIGHQIYDSVRGDTTTTGGSLSSNGTGAEYFDGSYGLTSFDSNGFSLLDVSNGQYGVNGSAGGTYSGTNASYVAWCFKGGGTAVSNTDGTLTSQVSANQAAGFSIVKYTANATSGATIGHGLNQELDLLIVKSTNLAQAWNVYVKDVTNTDAKYLRLNQTDGILTTANPRFIVGNFSSTVFSVGNDNSTNGISGTDQYIAYCFHSVEGFSKIGSYTGTGVAGNAIVTGFEPAFILVKNISNGTNTHWGMFDNERDNTNPNTGRILANLSNAESTTDSNWSFDFTSNGFVVNSTAVQSNANGDTYIYLAIAADPDTTTPVVENSFDVVTYTGTGSTQSISTGFKPDLVWFKERNGTNNHQLYDSIRGDHFALWSNLADSEYDYSAHPNGDLAPTFTSTGFDTPSVANNGINRNGGTYVAWCWKAGDHDDNLPQINTEGTIDSIVSVNAAAGFSIVKWTGNGSTNIETIGHGLSSAPEMVIWKNIDRAQNWHVYNSYGSGSADWGYLNLTDAFGSANNPATMMNQTAPTSTIFTIYNNAGNANTANYSGEDYIAYCFHSVSGYQKLGSYVIDPSDPQIITIGFQPRFIMLKNINYTGGSWYIYDNLRRDSAEYGYRLFANLSNLESAGSGYDLDFTSNGFTIQGSGILSSGGSTYDGNTVIYLAIA